MKAAFLETSAVANLFYKAQKEQRKIQGCIPTGVPLVTSQYVIYELSRGFLRNLILIYNRSTLVSKFSDLLRYGTAMHRRTYFVGAMFEVFTKYFEANIETPGHVKPDEFQLIAFRSFLRRDIRRGWLKQQRTFSKIINDVGCRNIIPAPTFDENDQYEQELKAATCGQVRGCGLKGYVKSHRKDFEGLRAKLQNQADPDVETVRRIKSLRELYRVPNTDFLRTDCYSCGDAIIAHEAPTESTIITLNEKHLVPICGTFKKNVLPVKMSE